MSVSRPDGLPRSVRIGRLEPLFRPSCACTVASEYGTTGARCCQNSLLLTSGSVAGPSITRPSMSNLDPWQGQSQLRSTALNAT